MGEAELGLQWSNSGGFFREAFFRRTLQAAQYYRGELGAVLQQQAAAADKEDEKEDKIASLESKVEELEGKLELQSDALAKLHATGSELCSLTRDVTLDSDQAPWKDELSKFESALNNAVAEGVVTDYQARPN